MKNLKLSMAILLLILSISIQSQAQENITKSKANWSVEIDPATFAFGGYSLHVRFQPKNCDHLLIGLGTYAMNMPDVLVNLNEKNKNEGWDVRLNQGYSLFAEHHFTEVNRRWFVGAQLGLQQYKIESSKVEGSETFTNMLAMGYVGYTFRPFKNSIYIKPWAGIGYTSKLAGSNQLEDVAYDIASMTMFATLHIGYTF